MELRVGFFGKPHGIKGELILRIDESAGWMPAPDSCVHGIDKNNNKITRRIIHARPFKNGFIVAVDLIVDRNQAAALTGQAVFAEVRGLPADTFLIKDLTGSLVTTKDGRNLGTLVDVLSTGANDVYRVMNGDRELLIPALKTVITSFNKHTKELIVELPHGLEDAH
jgi:16S rRNA processing protein RimM